jgi:hypothetical protein
MPRPGTDILIVDGAPPGAAALDTGTAFMFGVAERGPVDRAVKVPSVDDYAETFGSRSGGSLLYDSVSAYFSEGGGSLYVARVGGAGLASATATLGTVLTVDAASPGTWGNDLTVETVAPSALEHLRAPRASVPTVIVVKLAGEVVDRSYVVNSADEAVAWSRGRAYVSLSVLAPGDLPPNGTTATLAGGADATGSGASDIDDALALFEYGMGPGQVLGPGYTTTGVHESILAHCDATHRCGLLDLPDSGDPTVLAAAIDALRDVSGVRFVAAFAPWAIYPAEVSPATVTIPYSAIEAGIISRVDRAGNPNAPAAGADGVSRLAVGLSQTYTDNERQALNELGIDLAKEIYGDVRTYGYRTAAGPEDRNWLWYGNSRTLMAIAYECDAVAEAYVLKQIDGRRQLFSRLNKDLAGVCARYYDMSALYGETPADAYLVDTGPGVNTDETIANGEVHAVVKVKCSPAAEWVSIRIVKVPVERPIAA